MNLVLEFLLRTRTPCRFRTFQRLTYLEYHKSSPKYNYPKLLAPIEALTKKNTEGIENCKSIISEFQKAQDLLFHMIHTIGIKQKEKPQRVYELMGNYIEKMNPPEEADLKTVRRWPSNDPQYECNACSHPPEEHFTAKVKGSIGKLVNWCSHSGCKCKGYSQ